MLTCTFDHFEGCLVGTACLWWQLDIFSRWQIHQKQESMYFLSIVQECIGAMYRKVPWYQVTGSFIEDATWTLHTKWNVPPGCMHFSCWQKEGHITGIPVVPRGNRLVHHWSWACNVGIGTCQGNVLCSVSQILGIFTMLYSLYAPQISLDWYSH